MKSQLTVFVDSDAFVAAVKQADTTHEKAQILFQQLKEKEALLITSNYVFSETVTVLSQKMGHDAAVGYIDSMKSTENVFLIKWIDEQIEEVALEIFKRQTSKNTSFVDCTNMAFLKMHEFDAIFSFDEVYRKNGFKLVEDIV